MLNESKHDHPFVYQLLLSPQVKKCLLFISVLLCFCEVFAGANHNVIQKPAFVSPGEKDLYSALAVNYPHTGLEVNYHTVSANSSCRQNGQGFISAAAPVNYLFYRKFAYIPQVLSQVSNKQYLAHIYPSHNFW